MHWHDPARVDERALLVLGRQHEGGLHVVAREFREKGGLVEPRDEIFENGPDETRDRGGRDTEVEEPEQTRPQHVDLAPPLPRHVVDPHQGAHKSVGRAPRQARRGDDLRQRQPLGRRRQGIEDQRITR